MKKRFVKSAIAVILVTSLFFTTHGITVLADSNESVGKKEKEVTQQPFNSEQQDLNTEEVIEPKQDESGNYVMLAPGESIKLTHTEATTTRVIIQNNAKSGYLDYAIYSKEGSIQSFNSNTDNLGHLYQDQWMVITSKATSDNIKIYISNNNKEDVDFYKSEIEAVARFTVEAGKSYSIENTGEQVCKFQDNVTANYLEYALYEKKDGSYVSNTSYFGEHSDIINIADNQKLIITSTKNQNVTVRYPGLFQSNGIVITESENKALKSFTVESGKSYIINNASPWRCTFKDAVTSNYLIYAIYNKKEDIYAANTSYFGEASDIRNLEAGDKEVITSKTGQNVTIKYPYGYHESGLTIEESENEALGYLVLKSGKSYEFTNNAPYMAAFKSNVNTGRFEYALYQKNDDSYLPYNNCYGTTNNLRNLNIQERQIVTAKSDQDITIYYPQELISDGLLIKETEEPALKEYIVEAGKSYEIINNTLWDCTFMDEVGTEYLEYAIYNKSGENYVPNNSYFGYQSDIRSLSAGNKEVITSTIKENVSVKVPYMYSKEGLTFKECDTPALGTFIAEAGKSYEIKNNTLWTAAFKSRINDYFMEYALYFKSGGGYQPQGSNFGKRNNIPSLEAGSMLVLTSVFKENVIIKYPYLLKEKGMEITETIHPALEKFVVEAGKTYEIENNSLWNCYFADDGNSNFLEYVLYRRSGNNFNVLNYGFNSSINDLDSGNKITITSNIEENVTVTYPYQFVLNGLNIKSGEKEALYKIKILAGQKYKISNHSREQAIVAVNSNPNKVDLLITTTGSYTYRENISSTNYKITMGNGNSLYVQGKEENEGEALVYFPNRQSDNLEVENIDYDIWEALEKTDYISYEATKQLSIQKGENGVTASDTLKQYAVKVKNTTTGKNIDNLNITEQKIFFPVNTVNEGDILEIQISGENIVNVSYTVTINKETGTHMNISLLQKGYVVPAGITENDQKLYMQIYDQKGERKVYQSYTSQKIPEGVYLEDGEYSVVFFKTSTQLWSMQTLEELKNREMKEGTDYLLQKVVIEGGSATVLDVSGLKNLDADKISYFQLSETGINTNKETVVKQELIEVRFNYKVKDAYKERLQNLVGVVELPTGIQMVENSVIVGKNPADYTLSTDYRTLNITLNQPEGVVRFYVKPVTSDSTYNVAAKMRFKYGNTTLTESIGQCTINVPDITLELPAITATKTVKVTGIATPQKQVIVYVDGVNVAQTVALKNGTWKATITLPDKKENVYSLHAVSTGGGKVIAKTDKKKITYNSIAAEIDEFKLIYNNMTYNILALNGSGTMPVLSFASSRKMTFIVHIKNDDKVTEVKVSSTRSGEKKYLNAKKDEKTGRWIATGWFDSENKNYVPGTLNVEYKEKIEKVPEKSPITVEDIDEATKNLPDEIKENCNVKINENKEDKLDTTITYVDNNNKNQEFNYKAETGKANYTSRTELQKDNYIQIGKTDAYVKYSKNKEKDTFTFDTIDYSSMTKLSYVVTGADAFLDYTGGIKSLSKLSNGLTHASLALDGINILIDDVNFTNRISNSNLTAAQKQYALEQRDAVLAAKTITALSAWGLCLSASSITAGAIGILGLTGAAAGIAAVAGPVAICFLVGMAAAGINALLDDFMDYVIGGGDGGLFDFVFRWIIDPSGYVYEVVPDNRLEGVTATVYYKGEDGQPVLWDAKEYQQQNPLLTDSLGAYAWDVPEGEWQVKYEKDGYMTAYSAWLPVPPPQTEVNIAMTSTEEVKIEEVVLYQTSALVTFDKYMEVEGITNSSLQIIEEDTVLPTNVEPLDAIDYKQKKVAKQFKITIKEGELKENITYNLMAKEGIRTYSGVPLTKGIDLTKTYRTLPASLTMEDKVTVNYDGPTSFVLKGQLQGVNINYTSDNVRVIVKSNDENLVIQTEGIVIEKEGMVQIPVVMNLPVDAEITVLVQDTEIKKCIAINAKIGAAEEIPATEVPATEAPATEAPVTEAPVTEVPATEAPATEVPATEVPATKAPATEVPATEVPATEVPATEVPATEVPATEVPATKVPATEVPATKVPATEVPATEVPATEVPATKTPVTKAPSTQTPSKKISVKKVTGFKVAKTSSNSISLRWNKSQDVAGYQIYKYDAKKKKYVVIKTLNKKSFAYRINKLKDATSYKFYIVGYKLADKTKKVYGSKSFVTGITNLSKVKISSIKRKGKSILIKWKKLQKAYKYEVVISRKKSKGFKRIKTVSNKVLSYCVKKRIKSKQIYYFKIRAFKMIANKKIYGAYSTVKSIRMR